MRRRRQGLVPLGAIDPGRLELPSRRARDLQLQSGWREVAGELVARHAPAVAVRRGVLEIRRPSAPWARTLAPELPRLAARLAAARPALGIRRFRVRDPDERGAPAVEIDPTVTSLVAGAEPDAPAEPIAPSPPAAADRPAASPGSLGRVRDLYLDAARRRQ